MQSPLEAQNIIDSLQELLKASDPDFRSILKLSNQLSKLDEKFQRFAIDAKTLIHLGRDSIKDHTTALIELVKNSYDADALSVDVDVFCNNGSDLIRVADNGFGMTRDELLNSWLRIGFSNKRESKMSSLGRRKTGEKGIGRISTDRLGADLELITKTEKDGIIGLKVKWDEFDVDGKDVFDIDIELTNPESINIPLRNGEESPSGTEIRVNNLRQPWSEKNIENLYNELGALTSPFSDVKDFAINLNNDTAPQYSQKVQVDFLGVSTIEVRAVFDGSKEVYYSIKDKFNTDEIVDTIDLQQFYNKTSNDDDTSKEALASGPIEVRLLFFLREGASVATADFTLSDLREFLDNNNGVKIYRDKIAVKPYGFPKASFGYDWLGLGQRKARNPAGISRGEEYTVSPNQLVGAVFISRDDNPLLVDSAAREGLIESDGFSDMKDFVLATLRLLESHYAKIYPSTQKAKKEKEKFSAHQEAEKIKLQLTGVKEDLSNLKQVIEEKGDSVRPQAFIKPIAKSISAVEDISEEVDTTITELLNWQRVLGGLATMGISYAVFGHETEASITQFKGSVNTAKLILTEVPPNVVSALEELDKAIKHSKKIAAWGAYALTRVQREKRNRRKTQIFKTINNVVKELRPAFEAAAIEIKVTGENFYATTYPMDIESVLVNLLTNAYTASVLKSGQRTIEININKEDQADKKGFYFTVADTGPGIAKEFAHRVFEPLFSTKTVGTTESKSVGTGLGLTIVKSIVDELLGDVSFDHDPVLKGARFKIWLPKID